MVWVLPNTSTPAMSRKTQPIVRLRFLSSLRSITGSLRVSSHGISASSETAATIAVVVMNGL